MEFLKKHAAITITGASKVRDVELVVPGLCDLASKITGRDISDSAWKMAGNVSLNFMFVKRLSWEQERFDEFLEALNQAAQTGEIPESYLARFSGKRKSLIEHAEERDLWSGHRVYFERLPFTDANMSFVFLWHMAATANGGASPGELYYAAMQIEDRNVESWVKELTELGRRIETRARASLDGGHSVSAREAFLRAANYYRMALWTLDPLEPRYREIANEMRSCFHKAAALLDPPIKVIDIPYKDGSLLGYFRSPDSSGEKRPTLIFLGGGETFAEDGYYVMGSACKERGFNFFTFEYPGEGLAPFDGFFHCPDEEVPVGAALDYLYSRSDVDPERVATYGISMGGYVGPRAAAYDDRIKAVVTNSMLYDIYPIFQAYEPLMSNKEMREFLPSAGKVLESLVWRWGGDVSGDPRQIIELNKSFKVDPSLVTCPVLILIGEGEYRSSSIIRTQQHHAMDVMPNPKNKLVIGKANEGMAHHCTVENPYLVSEVVFDWLDEIFQAV